jgi:hypothetical protein
MSDRVYFVNVGVFCVLLVAAIVVFNVVERRRRAHRTRRAYGGIRVYIAGGSSERLAVARPLIERAKELGVDVTADWTRDPGWDLGRTPTLDELRESARRDIAAIEAADVVWLVVPRQKSEGASAEVGYALALRKRLVVSGEVGARNIFALLARPEDRFASHEEALTRVAQISRRRETEGRTA